jgi:Ca2+-binding RTX toxin-like protein
MRRVVLVLALMAAALLMDSGMALAVTKAGGPGSDTIVGTATPDSLAGGSGSDRVLGGGGNDFMHGGPLPPSLTSPASFEAGPNNADFLMGSGGDDIIDGNLGVDLIFGGPGGDLLADGENRGGATDVLMGGSGDDVLNTFNAPPGQDVARCGPGTDTAVADRTDVLLGCERVFFRPPTANVLGGAG